MSQGIRTVNSGARYTRETPSVRRRLLIEAAYRCLASGGIESFTVDCICREAGVSRGLINHYFDGKDELLVAVYQAALYGVMTQLISQIDAMPEDAPAVQRLGTMVDACFLPDAFQRANFLVWLALWGEASKNPRLRTVHREHYDTFLRHIGAEIAHVAEVRNLTVDALGLARSFIALWDGLWLEWCLDEHAVGVNEAREACWDLLESKLGPLR